MSDTPSAHVCSCCLQEEVLLSSAVALAVTSLLLNLQKGSGQDYAFACFFLISATLLLRVRWFLGAAILAVPVIAVFSAPLWGSDLPHVLPGDAELHLTIAWALGALIAYLAEDQRRCAALDALPCRLTLRRLPLLCPDLLFALPCACMRANACHASCEHIACAGGVCWHSLSSRSAALDTSVNCSLAPAGRCL